MPEIWIPVRNFPRYQLSNYGRVRSIDHIVQTSTGSRRIKGRVLKQSVCPNTGYAHVIMRNEDEVKTAKIHRLVAEHFVSNVLNNNIVDHKDGDKTNNDWDNLEWVTQSENVLRAIKIGLRVYNKHGRIEEYDTRTPEADR